MYVGVRVYVRMCKRGGVRVCMWVCVCVSVCAGVGVDVWVHVGARGGAWVCVSRVRKQEGDKGRVRSYSARPSRASRL